MNQLLLGYGSFERGPVWTVSILRIIARSRPPLLQETSVYRRVIFAWIVGSTPPLHLKSFKQFAQLSPAYGMRWNEHSFSTAR